MTHRQVLQVPERRLFGYTEEGPSDGAAVMLLHGWPYDIHSFAEVGPSLADAGYRAIIPYLRGYGTTRFLSDQTPRNGQQSALAVDTIALMDVLGIGSAILGGFDWGAPTANVVAALWPDRCTGMVLVSGYLIGSQKANEAPLPPAAELAWWYQFYFATERGRAGYDRNRNAFAKLIWKLATGPMITVPTITLEGDANGVLHPEPSAYAAKFSGPYEHRTITAGIGHDLPQEAPQAFAQAVLDVAAD